MHSRAMTASRDELCVTARVQTRQCICVNCAEIADTYFMGVLLYRYSGLHGVS